MAEGQALRRHGNPPGIIIPAKVPIPTPDTGRDQKGASLNFHLQVIPLLPLLFREGCRKD